MKRALLALLMSSTLGFVARADQLPIDKSNPVAGDAKELTDKANYSCGYGGCVSNFCQTPYGYCYENGFFPVGIQCGCNGIFGTITAN